MFISLNQLGSFVVDVDGDRLDARMIRENASVADYFTIVKGTTTSPPPPATSVSCAGRAAGSACGDGNVCDGNGKCVASLTPIPNGITQYEPQIPPKATSTGGGGGPGGGGNGPEGFPLTGDLSSPAWVCADGNTHLQWKAGPTVKSSTGTDVPLNDVQYASSPNPACVFNVCEDRDGALEMPVTRPTLEELRSATYPASDGNGCDKSDGPGLCPIETYTDKVCRPGDPTDRSCDPTKQEICALKCDGVDCTKSQHVCAVRATSCGEGLPQLGTFFDPDINRNSECRDIRQCADPGSVAFTDGATDENDMENEAALRVEQTNEQAEAQVREQFARPAPAPNDPYDYGQECTLDNGQEVAPTNTTPVAEGAQGNRSMEKPKWKINFSPGFLQKVELKPFPLGFAEPRLKVKSDWGAGAYILGDRIEIIGVHGQAEASLCGAQYQAYAVLLTQKIDITGNGIEPQGTPSATIAECRAKLDGLVAKANELKKALSDAVKVRRSFLERKVDQANQLVDETWSTIVLPSHEFFIRIGELAELTDPANAYTKYRAYAESWARELIGEARFQAIQKEQELIADAQERATAVFRSALWEAFAVRDEVAGRARALTDSANNAIALTEHAVNAVIENYENKANEFFNNQAAEVKSYIRETVAGGTTFEDRVQLFDRPRQFTLVAVKQPFALGPIPGVIEVESGGQWGVPGGLFYKVKAVATSEVSDNLLDRAGASAGFYGTPMVSAHARVYVAAGIANRFGDVRFGVNGQLHLVTFTSKLEGSLHLRQGKPKADPRTTIDSSYLASKTSGFTGKGAFHAGWDSFPWELSWGFNAGGKLSLLSGEIDIMARVRIAFFKKTFKRRLAHWKGKTLPEFTWNKVGKFDSGDVGIAIPNPLSFNFKAQVKFPRMSLPRIPNISEYIKSLGEDLELGSSQGGEVHQGLSLGYKGICVPKAPGQTVCGNGKVYDDYFQECRCPYGTLESATLNKCATCAEIAQAEGTGKPLFSTFEVDSDKRCISVKECEDHFLTSEGKIQRLGNECVRRGL
jgi:hypothetical protein